MATERTIRDSDTPDPLSFFYDNLPQSLRSALPLSALQASLQPEPCRLQGLPLPRFTRATLILPLPLLTENLGKKRISHITYKANPQQNL